MLWSMGKKPSLSSAYGSKSANMAFKVALVGSGCGQDKVNVLVMDLDGGGHSCDNLLFSTATWPQWAKTSHSG